MTAAVAIEAKPERAGEVRMDQTKMHVIACPACGWTLGEAVLVAGLLGRYRCKRCREWCWLAVVAETQPVN